LVSLFDVMIQ